MLSKALVRITFVSLFLALQVHGHAAVAPVLGVSGNPVRGDVKRPNGINPCGAGVNIASDIDTSTASPADATGSFNGVVFNFNKLLDGSRKVTAAVDPTGTGQSFTKMTVTTNGDLVSKDLGSQPIVAQLPTGTTCTGGAAGNLCLVQFKNAVGFGNCMVVSQDSANSTASDASSTDTASATLATETDSAALASATDSAASSTETDTSDASATSVEDSSDASATSDASAAEVTSASAAAGSATGSLLGGSAQGGLASGVLGKIKDRLAGAKAALQGNAGNDASSAAAGDASSATDASGASDVSSAASGTGSGVATAGAAATGGAAGGLAGGLLGGGAQGGAAGGILGKVKNGLAGLKAKFQGAAKAPGTRAARSLLAELAEMEAREI